jgi:hypothetical protein
MQPLNRVTLRTDDDVTRELDALDEELGFAQTNPQILPNRQSNHWKKELVLYATGGLPW